MAHKHGNIQKTQSTPRRANRPAASRDSLSCSRAHTTSSNQCIIAQQNSQPIASETPQNLPRSNRDPSRTFSDTFTAGLISFIRLETSISIFEFSVPRVWQDPAGGLCSRSLNLFLRFKTRADLITDTLIYKFDVLGSRHSVQCAHNCCHPCRGQLYQPSSLKLPASIACTLQILEHTWPSPKAQRNA
jgi:hypothetical protein